MRLHPIPLQIEKQEGMLHPSGTMWEQPFILVLRKAGFLKPLIRNEQNLISPKVEDKPVVFVELKITIMEKLKTLLFAVCCLALVLACSEVSDETDLADLKSGNMYGADKSGADKMVTVPFNADFSVWRALPMGEGEACAEGYSRETMMGEGEITHLGEISTFMTFCVEDATSMYAFTELGYFVAANGDTLFVNIPGGQVLPGSDKEGYVAHFNDNMYFMGGTGRFEGAMGMAMTNAYVYVGDGTEFRTDFWSYGHLKLKKGKR